VTFIVVVVAGYLIGNKAFPKPNTPAERFLGVVPAIITGYALLTYLVFVFAKSPLLTVGVSAPSQSLIGNYVLVIFLIAIVAVVIGLISASAKKGGGAKK
jgi:hypothetical protein